MSKASSAARARQPAPDTANAPHVLVVDDQRDNAMLLQHYLEAEGYRVSLADDGRDALRAVALSRPDLVLLDVMMPHMDGFEVCRELKARPDSALLPVVLVTALEASDDRIAGIEAGADEFLSKPVNPHELLARVRSLLRLHSTRLELEEARLAVERARGEQLRRTFERYVSPKLVETILTQPERSEDLLVNRNKRLEATVLFADMRGFTRLSEQNSPEVVVGLLNEYFSCLTEVAFRHDGTVFNMAGDALLVGFGVPLPQPDSVSRALLTAGEMQAAFDRLVQRWRKRYGVDAGLGIGINHGDVIAGNIGSPSYMNYTVIGDAVNQASRLTGLAAAGDVLALAAVRERADLDQWGFTEHTLRPPRGPVRQVGQAVFRVEYPPAAGQVEG